jgi:hypothetical protein
MLASLAAADSVTSVQTLTALDVITRIAWVLFVGTLTWLGTFGRERTLAQQEQRHAKQLADERERFDAIIMNQRQDAAKQFEALQAEHARQGTEFGLYATARHRAYPRVYRLYRVALDRWYDAMKRGGGDNPLSNSAAATKSYERAVNVETLEDLYLSQGVRAHVDFARKRIATFKAQVKVMSKTVPGTDGAAGEVMSLFWTANAAVNLMRNAMIDELRTSSDAPVLADQQLWERVGRYPSVDLSPAVLPPVSEEVRWLDEVS